MSRPICVIDLPGLSADLLQHIPADSRLGRWLANQHIAALLPPWPAVTCAVQATLTTGVSPSEHGIVSNGIATYRSPEDQALVDAASFAAYRRQISFWEQSNQLIQKPRFWQDETGKSRFRTALLFFQLAMPGFVEPARPAADIVITPKPQHSPDGKLTSLLWTDPPDLGSEFDRQLGPFPLMNYWGPMASIASSEWIARAASWVWTNLRPLLQFSYVPHLDYDLQRFGPASPEAAKAVVDACIALDPLLEAVLQSGELIVLSEYSMQSVNQFIQPNRVLAEAGLLLTRPTADGRLIDYERSRAIAMVDHQIAHVYARDREAADQVAQLLSHAPLSRVDSSKRISHPRAGHLQLEAHPNAWFDYRWWSRPEDAPVFAAMVDIHRKPGYDPLELFFDLASGGISQDPRLLRGSHGANESSIGLIAMKPISAGVGDQVQAADFPTLLQRLME